MHNYKQISLQNVPQLHLDQKQQTMGQTSRLVNLPGYLVSYSKYCADIMQQNV